MESSDDEIPLSKRMNGSNGGQSRPFLEIIRVSPHCLLHPLPICLLTMPAVRGPISAPTIPQSLDNALDRANPSNGTLNPGITIKNEVVQPDHPMPDANGVTTNGVSSKRKSRGSLVQPSYAEAASSDEEDQPLVRIHRGWVEIET